MNSKRILAVWTSASALALSSVAEAQEKKAAAATLVDAPANWIKENVMALVNNDLWSWLAIAYAVWNGALWMQSHRPELLAKFAGAAIFGALWLGRAEIMGQLGSM